MTHPFGRDEIPYLLSFLMILVDRNGGELTIERLSEYAGTTKRFTMQLDTEHDKVVLKVIDGIPQEYSRKRKPL